MDLVQILVEEDGYLEQRPRPEAADAYPPVPLQPEQCSQPLLAAPRRAQLDEEPCGCGATVPEAVDRPRRNDQDVTGAERAAAQADAKAELARCTLEAFPLARVHVRRDEPIRLNEQLARDAAVRPLAKDDRLTRHGIRDCV